MSELSTPSSVVEITGTTTYDGAWRLFWINIHATVNATVLIGDDTTELMSIYCAANDTEFMVFTPSIAVKTSLKITLSAGTAKITTSRAPS